MSKRKGQNGKDRNGKNQNGKSKRDVVAVAAAAVVESDFTRNRPKQGSGGLVHGWIAVIAILSFALGILTPPSLYSLSQHYLYDSSSSRSSSSSSNSSSSSTERKLQTDKINGSGKATTNQDGSKAKSSSSRRPVLKRPRVVCTDKSVLSEFLHEERVPGMHILCIHEEEDTPGKQQDRPKRLPQQTEPYRVSVWTDGVDKDFVSYTLAVDTQQNPNEQFFTSLSEYIGLDSVSSKTSTRPKQPWAVFGRHGNRLVGQHDQMSVSSWKKLRDEGWLIIMDGGQWIWPGVREGFLRTVDLSYLPGSGSVLEARNATIETLSLHPLVLSVEGFLSEQECDHIQEEATPQMRYSEVSLMDKDAGRPASDFRTSQTAFLSSYTGTLRTIDDRTASLVRIPKAHQENVQVLRYGKTEKYDAHHDYFDPRFYQTDKATLEMIEYGRKNRMATVFWYLSDVEKGGETNFPRYNRAPQPVTMAGCHQGLKVKPQRGKVIIFYSLMPDGGMDEYSLHAACPVRSGTKWAANKWVWNAPL